MSRARGMTLLEALAATVLMALIVGTCLPVFTAISRPDAHEARVSIDELAQAADRIMADPGAFGLEQDLTTMIGREAVEVTIATPSGPLSMRVSALGPTTTSGHPDHAWVVCESQGIGVSRWIARCVGEATP